MHVVPSMFDWGSLGSNLLYIDFYHQRSRHLQTRKIWQLVHYKSVVLCHL
jgi:hypothetical protein